MRQADTVPTNKNVKPPLGEGLINCGVWERKSAGKRLPGIAQDLGFHLQRENKKKEKLTSSLLPNKRQRCL